MSVHTDAGESERFSSSTLSESMTARQIASGKKQCLANMPTNIYTLCYLRHVKSEKCGVTCIQHLEGEPEPRPQILFSILWK